MNPFHIIKTNSLPRMTAYKNDLLVHDKNDIDQHPRVPFIHFTRETGTHMIKFLSVSAYPAKGQNVKYLFGYATREKILKNTTIDLIAYIRREWKDNLIQYFDGLTVIQIDLETAIKLIMAYYCKTLIEFRK